MTDLQAVPAIELQTPPNQAQPTANSSDEPLEQVAQAAAEARRRAAEGVTTADLRKELKRSKRSRAWKRFGIVLLVIVALVAVAVAAVLMLFSVNQVSSDDMAPTLKSEQVVVSSKDGKLANGDVIAYRNGDEVAFGRVVAGPGSWVNIMNDGSLVVSDENVNNSLSNKNSTTSSSASSSSSSNSSSNKSTSSGSNAKISRQVPSDSYYVLGDAEDATISGLANAEDFVTTGQVIGKSLYVIWPLGSIGAVL